LAWYLPASTEQKAYSAKVEKLIIDGAVPNVPSMWLYEISANLIKARRAKQISLATLNAAMVDMDAIHYEVHHVNYTIGQIVKAAKEYHLQGYDALYFDLAKRRELPIATLDSGIRAACRRLGVKLL